MSGPETAVIFFIAGVVLAILWAMAEGPPDGYTMKKMPEKDEAKPPPTELNVVKIGPIGVVQAGRRREERMLRGPGWDDAEQPIGCRLDPTATEADYLAQVAMQAAAQEQAQQNEPPAAVSEIHRIEPTHVAITSHGIGIAGHVEHHQPAPVHHEPAAPAHDHSSSSGGSFDGGGGGFDGGSHGHGGHF